MDVWDPVLKNAFIVFVTVGAVCPLKGTFLVSECYLADFSLVN